MAATLRGLEGKHVLITGAAKGQGFSHAKAFADAGADIAALDITEPIVDIYPLATAQMMTETVAECNGVDDNCNGAIDEISRACYTGPAGTNGVGVCHGGTQQCNATACGTAPNACCTLTNRSLVSRHPSSAER